MTAVGQIFEFIDLIYDGAFPDERWEQVELEIALARRFVARTAETLNSVNGRMPKEFLDSLKTLGA